jgi:hypothetical protein
MRGRGELHLGRCMMTNNSHIRMSLRALSMNESFFFHHWVNITINQKHRRVLLSVIIVDPIIP